MQQRAGFCRCRRAGRSPCARARLLRCGPSDPPPSPSCQAPAVAAHSRGKLAIKGKGEARRPRVQGSQTGLLACAACLRLCLRRWLPLVGWRPRRRGPMHRRWSASCSIAQRRAWRPAWLRAWPPPGQPWRRTARRLAQAAQAAAEWRGGCQRSLPQPVVAVAAGLGSREGLATGDEPVPQPHCRAPLCSKHRQPRREDRPEELEHTLSTRGIAHSNIRGGIILYLLESDTSFGPRDEHRFIRAHRRCQQSPPAHRPWWRVVPC